MVHSGERTGRRQAAPDGSTSDSSLLQRLRRGNSDAATELYHRYAGRLRALAEVRCSANLARRLDADDIVQSVFRSFFREAQNGYYDVPAGEDLWKLLLVIALNKIRAQGAFHLAAKRDVRLTTSVDGLEAALGPGNEPSVLLQLVVDEALERLDDRQREVVELRLQGHEVAEIADKTGRSKRTVERSLQDIRAKLQSLLGQDH
jgi:RNA polymerase sigma-70 factor (ECF subfamily)